VSVTSDRINETIVVTAPRVPTAPRVWWVPNAQGVLTPGYIDSFGSIVVGRLPPPEEAPVEETGDPVTVLDDPDVEDVQVLGVHQQDYRVYDDVEGNPGKTRSKAEDAALRSAMAQEASFIMSVALLAARTATGAGAEATMVEAFALRAAVTEHIAAIYGSATAANEAAYAGYLARTLNRLKSNPVLYSRMLAVTAAMIGALLGGLLYWNHETQQWELLEGANVVPPGGMDVPSLNARIRMMRKDFDFSKGYDLDFEPYRATLPLRNLSPLSVLSPVTRFLEELVHDAVRVNDPVEGTALARHRAPEVRLVHEALPGRRYRWGYRVATSPHPYRRLDPMPKVRFAPGRSRDTGAIRVPNARPVPRVVPRLDPAQTLRRKDEKWKSTLKYLALLALVNKTWGRLSEVMDFGGVILRSVYDSEGEYQYIKRWDLLFRLLQEGRLEIDMDKFVTEFLYEQLMDFGIAKLGQIENQAMREFFPLDHPANNMFGRPSTWYSRAQKLYEAF